MDELVITVISLVGGAGLASVSGIIVTLWANRINETRELNRFKLEFKLAIEHLCGRLEEFDEVYHSNDVDRANEYISTPFVNDPIFQKYSEIAKLSLINITLYYEMIKALKDIDRRIGGPNPITLFRGDETVKDVCRDNPIWNKLDDFCGVYFDDLKGLMRSLS